MNPQKTLCIVVYERAFRSETKLEDLNSPQKESVPPLINMEDTHGVL